MINVVYPLALQLCVESVAGAFVEPCDGGIVLFCSPEKAQEFVDKDPYYMEGLVTSYKV